MATSDKSNLILDFDLYFLYRNTSTNSMTVTITVNYITVTSATSMPVTVTLTNMIIVTSIVKLVKSK